jgi:hypothetical protein
MEETTNTDVNPSDTPAEGDGASTSSVSAPAGANVSSQQSEQTAPASEEAGQAEAAALLPETDDDLAQHETNPLVAPLRQLRQELRARNQTVDGLKPLEAWKPVADKYQDPQTVQTMADYYQSLNAPVIENGQPKRGEFGVPETTPLPFLQKIATDSPDTFDKMTDLIFRAAKLDPDRLEDYRNIDHFKTSTSQSTVVTPEQLQLVPQNLHEAFKRLSPTVREDIADSLRDPEGAVYDRAAIDQLLNDSQFFLDGQKDREDRTKREAEERERVQREQSQAFEQKVEEGRGVFWQQGYSTLVTSLAKEVQLSSDANTNEGLVGLAFSTLANALDPATAFIAENACKAAGTTYDPAIARLAEDILAHSRARVHFEQSRDTLRAGEARRLETDAFNTLMAKARPAILAIARMMGANGQTLRVATEQALGGAQTRPAINGSGAQATQTGTLPAGMIPGSPEAARHIRQQTLGS